MCARILVLGVAYKRGVSDTGSPRPGIINALRRHGADVAYADPHVPSFGVEEATLKAMDVTQEILRWADCALILTDHPEFDSSGSWRPPGSSSTRERYVGPHAAGRVIRL